MTESKNSAGPGRRRSSALSGACVFTPKPLPENREDDLGRAKNDALKLLSFRSRSSAELAKRLHEKGYSVSVTDEVLAIFKKQRLLNDAAFAEELVRSRGAYGASGRRRVERDLKAKGVSSDEISKALEKYSPQEEIERAIEAAEKRMGSLKGLARPKQKQRLFGFLARRGFTSTAVNAAFQKVFSTQVDLE